MTLLQYTILSAGSYRCLLGAHVNALRENFRSPSVGDITHNAEAPAIRKGHDRSNNHLDLLLTQNTQSFQQSTSPKCSAET
ncbi:hypothetical protein I7I48_06613 [Histoplasma ohiense]|nr:hypothetical protein I7I48_06613 [Histoplasma ohiense (nom. inval.)]